jgi:hypothetical protein
VSVTVARTQQRPLDWCGDGWRGYPTVLKRHYRQAVRTGKRGRPRLVIPPAVRLTQTIKHRDLFGRLLSVEIKAAFGTLIAAAGTVHIERFNGMLRDYLTALTRKTHAFAKTAATWDALVSLQIFDHNFARPQHSQRLPHPTHPGWYQHRSPAMSLGLADHQWSLLELLTTPL